MRELRCPKCGSVFSVDEADYASILSQVKGAEFDAEVARRLEELKRQHQDAMRMTEGSIPGQILRFAAPLFLGNLFQQLVVYFAVR